ncbi:ethylene-responsive transcription factor 5-like [Hibiscus syriacus]|uniref:Ethylene-responsive transcription factor 5-like n=1 Tax=Hibiscus syriacus TaxID=106335 RepID=A0A6A2WQK5_HIBSY|nr:ethylene-responsive transcription factor 5-like [Hibiscus syriacus]
MLKEENEQEEEVFGQVGELLGTLIKTFKASFLPLFQELSSYITPMWGKDKTIEERRIAICIFDDIAEHCRDAALKYYDTYLPFLLEACNDESPDVRQAVILGVGLCVEFGRSVFKPLIQEALFRLNVVFRHPNALHSDNMMAYDNAVSALGKICQFHQDSIDVAQLKLKDIQQGTLEVTQYYNNLKVLWEELDMYSEVDWGEDLEHTKTPLPTIGEAFAEVRREETHRRVMMGDIKEPKPVTNYGHNPTESSALVSRGPQSQKNRAGNDSKLSRSRIDFGVATKENKALLSLGSSSTVTHVPTEAVQDVRLTKSQLKTLQKLLGAPISHGSLVVHGIAFNITSESSYHPSWILDSGASDHMTCNLSLFHTYAPCHNQSRIRIVDGSYSSIARIGVVRLTKDFLLEKVLYVPSLSYILLSEHKSGRMISTAKVDDGLYMWDDYKDKNKKGVFALSASNEDTVMMWHRSDLWGPSRVKNIIGARWFITFIDDYTRGKTLSEDETLHTLLIITPEPILNTTVTQNSKDDPVLITPDLSVPLERNELPSDEIPIGSKLQQPNPSEKPQLQPPEIIIYSREHFPPKNDIAAVPNSSNSEDYPVPDQSLGSSNMNLPIAVRKGTITCTQHPISQFVSYGNLSKAYKTFVTNIDSVETPINVKEALKSTEWRNVVFEEMNALKNNGTWEVTNLPEGKKTVGWDDSSELMKLKHFLSINFELKDFGNLKYFLGLEVARTRTSISISQRKYVLDLLAETGMLRCKPAETPMEFNSKLGNDDDEETVYRMLRYLKRTRGKGLHFKKNTSRDKELYTDADWARSSVVARSSAETEYRAISWYNQDDVSIAHNSVHHDRTKQVEIDRHFIKEKFANEKSMVNAIAKVNGSMIDGRKVSSVEALYEIWSSKKDELSFWFDWVAPLLDENGIPMAYCLVDLFGAPLLCCQESFLQRVASPFDVPKMITFGAYGRSFKVRIRIGSVFQKQCYLREKEQYGFLEDHFTKESWEENLDNGRHAVLAEGEENSNEESQNRVIAWLEDGRITACNEQAQSEEASEPRSHVSKIVPAGLVIKLAYGEFRNEVGDMAQIPLAVEGDGFGIMEEIDLLPKSGGADGLRESSGSPLMENYNTLRRNEEDGKVKKRLFERVYRNSGENRQMQGKVEPFIYVNFFMCILEYHGFGKEREGKDSDELDFKEETSYSVSVGDEIGVIESGFIEEAWWEKVESAGFVPFRRGSGGLN